MANNPQGVKARVLKFMFILSLQSWIFALYIYLLLFIYILYMYMKLNKFA
jgi:hypothetical protein